MIENLELNKCSDISSVYDIECNSVNELLYRLIANDKNFITYLENKTDLYGDHKGSWHGFAKPTATNPGIQNQVDKNTSDIDILENSLNNTSDELLKELNNKMDINSLITMANLGQDVKEALTGGSVAVVGNNAVQRINIKNKSVSYEKTNFVTTGLNLLNPDTITTGYYMDLTGKLTASSTYLVTDFIPILKGEYIAMCRNVLGNENSFRSVRYITLFDSSYNVITGEGFDNSADNPNPYQITTDGTYFARVTIRQAYLDRYTMLYKGFDLLPMEEFYYKISRLKLIPENFTNTSIDNPLNGKSIIGFGDSIMRGVGSGNKGIVDLIGSRNNMTVNNYSVSGAKMIGEIENQLSGSVSYADYIILEGGINDAYEDVLNKLGTVNDFFGSTPDKSTFSGSVESLIKSTMIKFVGAKIIFVIVHNMSSREYPIVKQTNEKIYEVCNKWGIPILDMTKYNFNTRLEEYKKYTNNSDATHPTTEGYEKFYLEPIEKLLKSL